MSEWIRCSEQMPPYRRIVIIFSNTGRVQPAELVRTDVLGPHWNTIGWVTEQQILPTHWMPLPEPPP